MDRGCKLGDRGAVASGTHGRRPAGRAVIRRIRRHSAGGPQNSSREAIGRRPTWITSLRIRLWGNHDFTGGGKGTRLRGGGRRRGRSRPTTFSNSGSRGGGFTIPRTNVAN